MRRSEEPHQGPDATFGTQAARAMRALPLILFLQATPAAAQNREAQPPASPPRWYDSIVFKAWVQLDATFPETNSTVGTVSNFRIRRARPTFISQVDPLTKVQFQMDLSTGRAGSGASNASVTDTFAERKIPGFGYFAFGQQLLPFGHEVYEDNAALRSPLELSFAAEQIALLERDIGVYVRSLAGEDALWRWSFAFVNGQGYRSADANANKTWAGRLTYRVQPGYRVGVSGIVGSWRAVARDFDRHVLGIEFQAHPTRAFMLEGEFYNARFVDSVTAPGRQARLNGGYLMLESWIGPLRSIPFVRYQRTYGDLDYRSIDLGWRHQVSQNQRFTVEYDIVEGDRRDSLGARWQLAF